LFLPKLCLSQNHTIIDSETKEIIPFAAIELLNQNKGFYANEYGKFSIKEFLKDSIKISCLGYNSLLGVTWSLSDTIGLDPKTQNIPEVILYSSSKKRKTIGGKAKNITWHIGRNTQLGLLLKPSHIYKNSFIEEILIPISKLPASTEKKQRQFRSVFRLHLFSNENDIPNSALLKSPIIVYCNQDSKNLLRINIAEKNIQFDSNGIFICVEMIGEINSAGEIIDKKNPVPSFKFTNKQTKEFLSSAYYKGKSSDEWIVVNRIDLHMKRDIFLALGLVVSVYEK